MFYNLLTPDVAAGWDPAPCSDALVVALVWQLMWQLHACRK